MRSAYKYEMRFFNKMLVTWFGCGFVPVAPGTAGSIGALPLCWALLQIDNLFFRISLATLITGLACITSGFDQKFTKTKDPSYVVIDEVAGMCWSLLIAPYSTANFVAGFLLFRVFDILKPFPARTFDRMSKTAKSPFARGAYIVLDDVIAGFFAAAILHFSKAKLTNLFHL